VTPDTSVDGDTSDGNARFGASPAMFDTVFGDTRAGSPRLGTSCATLGTERDAVDDPRLGRPRPSSGVDIEGEAMDGRATVGRLALEPELEFASTGTVTSPRGITPRTPGTIRAASPI
jgi:hypothetical protein